MENVVADMQKSGYDMQEQPHSVWTYILDLE